MNIFQFCWSFIQQVLTKAYGYLGFILLAIPFILDYLEKKYVQWHWDWWPGMKDKRKLLVLPLAIVLILWSILLASYQTYQGQQDKINNLQELFEQAQEVHRPMLTIDAIISQNDTSVYSGNEFTIFTLTFDIKNIGDRAAYQSRFRAFAAPLANPEDFQKLPNIIQENPIYSSTKQSIVFHYFGHFTKLGNKGIVVVYTDVRYSSDPNKADWKVDKYWFAFNLNFDEGNCSIGIVEPSWKTKFDPYIDLALPND